MANGNPIVGIDFSGSKSPGRKIWVTEGSASASEIVEIESIEPAKEKFGVAGREQILDELVSYIAGLEGRATVGLDFPFGLARDCVDADEWRDFLIEFHDAFSGETIESFPGDFQTRGTSKREVDFRFAGQSPFSPQIEYQVFYGIRDVLYPLVVEDESALALPMQEQDDEKPALVEVYPAAAFGRLCCYRTGYKGGGEKEETRRRENLQTLETEFDFKLDERRRAVVGSDDALDSLCAACTAARASFSSISETEPEVEGYIFT